MGAEMKVEWYKEYRTDDGQTHILCRESIMDINQRHLDSTESFCQFLVETVRDYNNLGKKVFNIQIRSYDLEKYREAVVFPPDPKEIVKLHPLNEDMIYD